MRIAILHLSDFHVRERDRFNNKKIEEFIKALNILENVDEYIFAFSGDLSFSGKKEEFDKAEELLGRLKEELNKVNSGKEVKTIIVPGNHDLCLPAEARVSDDIINYYRGGTIRAHICEENSYLENFYKSVKGTIVSEEEMFFESVVFDFEGYKIQFNLINTAPFSTLKPDNKELHYYPNEKIDNLKRKEDVSVCVTVMHHNWEWFHWDCKDTLENAIFASSEFLLYGHDHIEKVKEIGISKNAKTWVSAAGEMDFSSSCEDSFNVLVLETETSSFNGYSFSWSNKDNMYVHDNQVINERIETHYSELTPSKTFIKKIKEDTFGQFDDFTSYFVFPQLRSDSHKEFEGGLEERCEEIDNIENLISLIEDKKKVLITGAASSGKTTLLKSLYIGLIGKKVPLFLSGEERTSIKVENYVRHLFEEQYSENKNQYERYLQLERNKKLIIIDAFDYLKINEKVLKAIETTFEYIVISMGNTKIDVVSRVKDEIGISKQYYEVHINPFYSEKREKLIRNIYQCNNNDKHEEKDIVKVNHLIDSLVQNNSTIFSLNPAFIIKYTVYFMDKPYKDYAKAESIFSEIFDSELKQSIIKATDQQNVDEMFAVFEEIAGYMFANKKDEITAEDLNDIVDKYNRDYYENVAAKAVLETGKNAKIIKETDKLSYYFSNKNHLAYFIAKYLIRHSQDDSGKAIEDTLKNICFGINADIMLFITYILNNVSILSPISEAAAEIFKDWEAVDFKEENIALLHKKKADEVKPPTKEEERRYIENKEKTEAQICSEDVIEARGVFDYNEEDLKLNYYKLQRAFIYTEILCKALPAFHSITKKDQKEQLAKLIYLYPRKIIYEILRPVDMYIKEKCKDILDILEKEGLTDENGRKFTEEDIIGYFQDASRAITLGCFDHFAELATSAKTIRILTDVETEDTSEDIERLIIIENTGNTEAFIKEAERLLKQYKGTEFEVMIKIIGRKHLLTNKAIPYNVKQKAIDKIFGEEYRKTFLKLPS